MQVHQQALIEMKHADSSQSLSALKVLWHCAKSLPRVQAAPACVHQAYMSSSDTFNPLSQLDWTKPLVVDVGCGIGSFALGLASRASAYDAVRDPASVQSSGAEALLPEDCNVLAIDVSRVAVRRCTGVARRLGLSHRYAIADAQLQCLQCQA